MANSPLLQPDIKNQFIAQLLKGGLDTTPVQHPVQAAGRMAQMLMAGLEMRRQEQESREAPEALLKILSGGQPSETPQQHPLGPIESGPRPANAAPAYAGNPSDPRGIRNNNALNIESGRFTQSQPGYAGSDGRFARFETPQQGLDAASNLLSSYGQRGINTVAGVINRWAPASDGNPVSNYANAVAKDMGIGPNDPINLADPATRQKLVMAMGKFENGRPIQMAQAMPQGGAPAAQSMPQQAAPQRAQVPPEIVQMIRHPNEAIRRNGVALLQSWQTQQMKPPEFKVIGKDQYGNEQHGWVDAANRRTTPNVPASAPNFVDTKKLRDEVRDLPSYKNLAQAAPVYKSMFEAAGRDNRAADVNLIYGMAKIMDPGSVVRESEMTIAQAVATLPQFLQSQIMSQLNATGRLSPEVRAAIMQEAHSRIGAYQGMFDQDMGMYRGIAQSGRFDPSHVIPQFGPFDQFKAPPVAPAPTGAAPAQGGQPIRAKDAKGNVIEWNGQGWVPVK